jgi:GNAT superfamily N-acetyltransferase
MKEVNTQIFHNRVAILHLTRKLATDLMKHSDFAGSDVLNQGLIYDILQSVHFRPRSTRLVAYHNGDKTAIGFLCLKENTDKLYLIEDVFVDPNYRKMGVANRLLNYATAFAKENGAKKIHLNVYTTNTNAINLYKKLGFIEIGRTIFGQGFLSGSAPSRVIKRVLIGQGFLTKLTLGKDSRLVELQTNSKKNRETLFSIYQRCMDQEVVDFFEINADNLINGSRHVWQPPFFKNVLINHLGNSFALIFNCPFSYKASVELYSTSNAVIPSMLDDLLNTLANRGIAFTQITLFNPNNTISNWFKEKRMMIFQFVVMGKNL